MSELPDLLDVYYESLNGDVVAIVAAQDFINTIPKPVLNRWLKAKAVDFIAKDITFRMRRDRALAVSRAGSRAFAAAVVAADSSSCPEEHLGIFTEFTINTPGNIHRPLGQANADDLIYAADDHEAKGNRRLALAAFLRTLSKNVPEGMVVADVYCEEEVDRLLASFITN